LRREPTLNEKNLRVDTLFLKFRAALILSVSEIAWSRAMQD
jgi:hypothetical protein